MKIRKGFVSNSSTTSFCLWGVKLSKLTDEVKENLFEIADDNGMEYGHGIYEYAVEDCFFGMEPTNMKDDETLLQFKQRILNQINGLEQLGTYEISDIQFYKDAGMEG